MLLRGTFFDVSCSKGSHMKDKNLSYKNKANLKPKINFLCSRNVAEKSFTLYQWSEADVKYCERLCFLRILSWKLCIAAMSELNNYYPKNASSFSLPLLDVICLVFSHRAALLVNLSFFHIKARPYRMTSLKLLEID